MNFGEKPKRRISINITSLVDILIVLLLFFMLTTQFTHMEILNLSVVSNNKGGGKAVKNNPTITITLIGDKKFSFRGSEFNLLQLKERIKPFLENAEEKDIMIMNTNKSSVQDVVTAIDYIRAVGGKNISIAEDK